MQKDGFPLMLKLLAHEPPRPYTIFFSHGFTIGDCKGNDILAGRYGTFTSKCALISRTCDCPSQKADDPRNPCRFLTQQSVEDACALSNVTARNRAFFPRCDFTNGLTNLTLTTANENSGIIFMLSLLWATETGRTLMKALKGHSVDIAILLLHFSVPTGIPVLDQARRVLASKNRE